MTIGTWLLARSKVCSNHFVIICEDCYVDVSLQCVFPINFRPYEPLKAKSAWGNLRPISLPLKAKITWGDLRPFWHPPRVKKVLYLVSLPKSTTIMGKLQSIFRLFKDYATRRDNPLPYESSRLVYRGNYYKRGRLPRWTTADKHPGIHSIYSICKYRGVGIIRKAFWIPTFRIIPTPCIVNLQGNKRATLQDKWL